MSTVPEHKRRERGRCRVYWRTSSTISQALTEHAAERGEGISEALDRIVGDALELTSEPGDCTIHTRQRGTMAKGSGGVGKGKGGKAAASVSGTVVKPATAPTADSVLAAARGLADRAGRVELLALRAKLGGTKEQQDRALFALQDSGRGVLMQNDHLNALQRRSPAEFAAHKAAAVVVGGGRERHILMLDRSVR